MIINRKDLKNDRYYNSIPITSYKYHTLFDTFDTYIKLV